jgi:ParB-like chromosome segregation protein Spo0J
MKDGTVYAGNMRLRAALHLGMRHVPAIVEDVPDRLAKERALRDNAQWGEWEDDGLAAMLREMDNGESEVEYLGFPERELQQLLDRPGPAAGLGDPDEIPEPVGPQYSIRRPPKRIRDVTRRARDARLPFHQSEV